MNEQVSMNRRAWNYRAYEFWLKACGTPADFAKQILEDPHYRVRRHIEYMGDVRGVQLLNPLGSNARKAVPLAVLGADVTVVDISEENAHYARELAEHAGVPLNYVVSDFLTYGATAKPESFDIAYLEGGILHYFQDLDALFSCLRHLLKPGGKLVLNDFHPSRKFLRYQDGQFVVAGDYFENSLVEGPVAYQDQFPSEEQGEFPQCLLRLWTTSEIINGLLRNRFVLKQFDESPRWDEKTLPGEFTIVAEHVPTDPE